MIHLASLELETPRISANQLGEFIFATEKRRESILRDQKFGNINAAPYYCSALSAIRRSFQNGHFVTAELVKDADLLAASEDGTPHQQKKRANNVEMLRRVSEICSECDPPAGTHRMVRKNAQLLLDGVTISVLPELVTENVSGGYMAFTKFRFSKNKLTLDVSEIVLLILQHYGQRQSRAGINFEFNLSKVVDCFSKTVIPGHSVARHRDQQLHRALELIRWLWPRIEPKST